MNKNQIGDIKHALKNNNYFYTDSNDKDWNELVEKGFAIKMPGWDDESAYYRVTKEGKEFLKTATA
jgi:predicted transcriptional regulator